jgi:hypothetical protein
MVDVLQSRELLNFREETKAILKVEMPEEVAK